MTPQEFLEPIISKRAPTTRDKHKPYTLWLVHSSDAYIKENPCSPLTTAYIQLGMEDEPQWIKFERSITKKTKLEEIKEFLRELPNRKVNDGSFLELVKVIEQLAEKVYKENK